MQIFECWLKTLMIDLCKWCHYICVVAVNTSDCIPQLYMHKVFEHLLMLWMGIHPHNIITTNVVTDFRELAEIQMIDMMCKWCLYICVETVDHLRLHPTSILYMYNIWAPSDVLNGHKYASLHDHDQHKTIPAQFGVLAENTCHGCLKTMPLHLCWGHNPLQTESHIYLS